VPLLVYTISDTDFSDAKGHTGLLQMRWNKGRGKKERKKKKRKKKEKKKELNNITVIKMKYLNANTDFINTIILKKIKWINPSFDGNSDSGPSRKDFREILERLQ
jgi:hypothetical protein